MRSLFVKIFLWFWLATIMIMASTIVLMSVIEPHRPFREDGRQVKRMARQGRMMIDILEHQGPGALRDFIAGKQQRGGRNVFLFNENGKAITGQPAPSGAEELATRTRKSGVTEFSNRGKRFMLARPIYGPEGRSYVIVREMLRRPRASFVWKYLNPRFLSLRLLVIFVIASIFCYWLAWYLTAPVRKLRTATQQLASGDLTTRVVPELGSRKDELADLGKDFDLMAERIESLVASQGRLLRDISHELRSPLARLNVALELARQRSGKEAEESLDRMERETERLNKLIGQLRTLTLLESGSESMEKKPFDLSSLVKRISDDAAFEAGSRNLSVKARLGEHIVVDGSEELLRRAIENVIRNAIRYSPEGTEVEISLQRQRSGEKDIAVMKVRDHGPGVPEDELKNLFNPFYRVAESRDRQTGGMGIGLAITDRAVRLHGGNVNALNAPDGGLVVKIDLPLT
ncbi:MAG: HAMP domain-containing protein [Thermodesulfovibrionia bacterium]|nr:HAMP domain-containing protein [Thermodesulfovibrionia bacterium]